jgi:hypothetical protein
VAESQRWWRLSLTTFRSHTPSPALAAPLQRSGWEALEDLLREAEGEVQRQAETMRRKMFLQRPLVEGLWLRNFHRRLRLLLSPRETPPPPRTR